MVALHDHTLSEVDRSRVGLALIISFILILSAVMFYVWLSLLPLLIQKRFEWRCSTQAALEPAREVGEGAGDRGGQADSNHGGGDTLKLAREAGEDVGDDAAATTAPYIHGCKLGGISDNNTGSVAGAAQVHKVVCARLWRAARVSPSCRRCSVA
jgi:hypothetical protein